MSVKFAPLNSLCQMKHGGTPSKAIPAYWKGQIPWVSPKDMKTESIDGTKDHISAEAVANSSTCIVQKGTILVVVRSGILAHTFPIATVTGPTAFNQDIKALIPTEGLVDPDYLYWFVRSSAPLVLRQGVKKGATVHSLLAGFLENLQVPLHPRSAQRRIVDLLSRAEGVVKLRREAQQKAEAIIPALFIEMFGDPAANPKRLPVRRVKDFVTRFEGGKNLQAASEGSTDFRILKVSAVTKGTYFEAESKPTPERYEPPKNHIVRVGDMLFSRANTVELVGATAVVEATDGRSLLPDKLWRFVWGEPVEQRYMHALFQNRHVRSELGKMSSGTSASMRNISQGKLYELALPVAPLAQQTVFARHADSVQSVLAQQAVALQRAEATFNALLARLFNAGNPSYGESALIEAEKVAVA